MKKALIISLVVLLTVGLFVACDADAEETVFKKADLKVNKDDKITVSIYSVEDTAGNGVKLISTFSADGKTWSDLIGTPITLNFASGAVEGKIEVYQHANPDWLSVVYNNGNSSLGFRNKANAFDGATNIKWTDPITTDLYFTLSTPD